LISLEKTCNKFIHHKNTKLLIKHNQFIRLKMQNAQIDGQKTAKIILGKHFENAWQKNDLIQTEEVL